MPTLTTTKTYADGDILFESDLDQIRTDIETFLNVTKIDDDNIQDSGITASTKLLDGSITAAKLGADSVTTSKILDANVTGAKLAPAIVDATSIQLSSNILSVKDGGITQAKRAALGQQVSSSSSAYNTTSTSYTAATNLTVTITTTGRPVFLLLVADGTTSGTYAAFGLNRSASTGMVAYYAFFRDSTQLTESQLVFNGASANLELQLPVGALNHIDVPAAGTYTYTLQVKSPASTTRVNYAKLVAYEL